MRYLLPLLSHSPLLLFRHAEPTLNRIGYFFAIYVIFYSIEYIIYPYIASIGAPHWNIPKIFRDRPLRKTPTRAKQQMPTQ